MKNQSLQSQASTSSVQKLLATLLKIALALAAALLLGALVWQGIVASGNPDPEAPGLNRSAVVLNTGLLVFREGLEVILVLAAITAGFKGAQQAYRRPVAFGVGLAFLASIASWFIAIAILDQVNAPQLDIQAATGLLAIVVLLVVMNWFFHNVYWTGWISHHNQRRRNLLAQTGQSRARIISGLMLLGFSAMYREGFEVVLFLQNLRLRAGSGVVLQGVTIGLAFTAVIGVLTFVVHQHLPYKKMLILTGVLLAGVLIVMVGEEVQEMQLAHWVSTTPLNIPIPEWMGLWFAIFPNVESLVAQALAAILVFGSYFTAQYFKVWRPTRRGDIEAQRPKSAPL